MVTQSARALYRLSVYCQQNSLQDSLPFLKSVSPIGKFTFVTVSVLEDGLLTSRSNILEDRFVRVTVTLENCWSDNVPAAFWKLRTLGS